MSGRNISQNSNHQDFVLFAVSRDGIDNFNWIATEHTELVYSQAHISEETGSNIAQLTN
jgi:hypothetical protein